MLKFNIKEHKIEELMKYGILCEAFHYHILYPKTAYSDDVYIKIHKENFDSIVDVADGYDEDDMCYVLEMLYELIKDGLIIKE